MCVHLCVFEACPGRSVFSANSDKCRCYVEALLEPPRRPVSIAGSASATSASTQRRTEHNVAKTNGGGLVVAGSLIHGIASRLRARSAAGVKYKDEDDTDVTDNCEVIDASSDTENDVGHLDDDEDDFQLDGEGKDTARRAGVAEDKYDPDAASYKTKEPLAAVDMYDDNVDSSSSESDASDADWNPKKPVYGNQVKRTKPPACLRFKLKTDPALDDELNAIRNDGTGPAGTHEAKPVIGNKRSHKKRLAPKSLTNKLKHMSHKKKSHLQTDAKKRVRRAYSKDGPKWEKKASIFLRIICLLNSVCYRFLNLQVNAILSYLIV